MELRWPSSLPTKGQHQSSRLLAEPTQPQLALFLGEESSLLVLYGNSRLSKQKKINSSFKKCFITLINEIEKKGDR